MANLKKYNEKRDFSKTKEPIGKVKRKRNKKRKFVIQHHLARKDHYDLRLEYNGVYVSFAIPKGLSFDTKDKRLAIKVEDHPLSYGNFEGTIPKGEYGAGTVMLFDKGYWEPYKDSPIDFNKGVVKFTLDGERLKGSWSVVPFKEENWLVIKEKDAFVGKNDINKYKTSIKTGRTMEEITKNKKLGGHFKLEKIEVTNPDKIIFKKEKVTKQDIMDYYQLVVKRMMPFLDNRLISTVRAPNGMNGEKFFMKHLNTKVRDIGSKKIKDKEGDYLDYYYIKNVNGLISEVNMNSYEFHVWGSHVKTILHPNVLVFDLDPDKGMSLKKVREGVRDLKSILDELSLQSFLKTSGGKGYHVVVPTKRLKTWKKFQEFAHDIAVLMETKWPEKYTSNVRKEARKGKIFIDWIRNTKSATSVAPYSLRIRKKVRVSMPIKWSELDKVKPDEITMDMAIKRLKRKDPWEGFYEVDQ